MLHELKIWPQYYSRVKDGSKTFEVRVNDRGFQQGDSVCLKEFDPTPIDENHRNIPKGYTGSEDLFFNVGYVHVLDEKTVIFSLLPSKKLKQVTAK